MIVLCPDRFLTATLGGLLFAAAILAAKSPATLADTVTLRTVAEIRLSADGQTVAAVVKSPDLARNLNRCELQLIETRDGSVRSLAKADSLSGLTWSSNGETLYVLAKTEGRYAILAVDRAGGGQRELASSTDLINAYAVARDGLRCVFTTASSPDAAAVRHVQETGYVYNWGEDSILTLIQRHYLTGQWEIFHLADKEGTRELARIPFTGLSRQIEFVEHLSFAPDGRHLAFALTRRGAPARGGAPFDAEVRIMDAKDGTVVDPMQDSIRSEMVPVWAADSRHLLFVRDAVFQLYDLMTGQRQELAWAVLPEPRPYLVQLDYDSEAGVAMARTLKGVYRLDFQRHAVAPEGIGTVRTGASYDRHFRICAFVDEASERRPELAVQAGSEGKVRRLSNLNPELDRLEFGRVEKLSVPNRNGTKVDGYLVYPVGYEPGRRYPLIIGTYWFRGGFILQAEWHTSFPAQALAGRGYAVLLLNHPAAGAQSITGNPTLARDKEGWAVLSTFETAVDLLVERGLADPERIGLYGWSHGAFIVEFLLAHSACHFRAACIGEGGDYNPGGAFLSGNPTVAQVYQNLFGGPLSPSTAPAYLEFSPALRAERFRAPLLLEFRGTAAFSGLEMYVPLRLAGIPAELVAYEGEEHNFVRPRARLASMARKVDWFDYWMRAQEDPAPEKAAQYTRWREMKNEWEARTSAAPARDGSKPER